MRGLYAKFLNKAAVLTAGVSLFLFLDNDCLPDGWIVDNFNAASTTVVTTAAAILTTNALGG